MPRRRWAPEDVGEERPLLRNKTLASGTDPVFRRLVRKVTAFGMKNSLVEKRASHKS